MQRLDGTAWRVWLDKQALATQFRRQQVDVGDLVAIAYEGREEADGENRAHHRFRLECEKTPPAPSAGEDLACDQCGLREPEHAPGCTNELPF